MQSLELIKMAGKNVYKIRLYGYVQQDEMKQLLGTTKELLNSPASDFRVFSDLRGFKPASPDVQITMSEIQLLFKEKGLKKVAVLVDNVVAKMQLKRLHKENNVKGVDGFFAAEEPNHMKEVEKYLSV